MHTVYTIAMMMVFATWVQEGIDQNSAGSWHRPPMSILAP
jgi:hypothetical protein